MGDVKGPKEASALKRSRAFESEWKGFDWNRIFSDRDGDGIVDSLDMELHLAPSCSHRAVLSAVMELSACLGFETMGLTLPIARADGGKGTSSRFHLYIGLDGEWKEIDTPEREEGFFLVREDRTSLIRAVKDLTKDLVTFRARQDRRLVLKGEKRRGFDLLNLFSTRGFFCNSLSPILPYLFPYQIVLLGDLSVEAAVEAANFCARLGLESVHLSFPLVLPFGEKPDRKRSLLYIGKSDDLQGIDSREVSRIKRGDFEGGIFLLPSGRKFPDILITGKEDGLGKTLRYLAHLPADSRGIDTPLFHRIGSFSERLKEVASQTRKNRVRTAKRIVRNYVIPDERQEIIGMLREELRGRRPKPDPVEVEISIARPENVRRHFARKIKRLLMEYGFRKPIQIAVLNAYKPGLSWVKEIVLEEVAGRKVDRVEIAFKEFEERGLEEPERWLQELYPVAEIVSRKLSIPEERIGFKKDSRIKGTYRVRMWQGKKVVYEGQFSPHWVKQPYLTIFPQAGNVHPCTGWVRMKVGEEVLIDRRVRTGMERLWEVYQNEILALLAKESDRLLRRKACFAKTSLFKEVRFEIHFDYPAEWLGIDEERISPLEALHEDLYFVTLDFFSRFAKKRGFKGLSPGQVLPVIHPTFRGRGGRMRFSLLHQSPESLDYGEAGKKTSATVRGIFLEGKRIGFDLCLRTDGSVQNDRLIRRLKQLSLPGLWIEGVEKESQGAIRLTVFGIDFRKESRPTEERPKKAIPVPLGRPIGYEEGVKIIRSLENLPDVHVVEEGRSYGGLPIFSVEHTSRPKGQLTSHGKQIVARPTLFINCRHHANEVSSTNAALKLSHLLTTRPWLREQLKKVNVVINPMENVDGVSILEEMLRLTPADKLHGGRYNSVGREFYEEYFDPETPFGEARVKPAIWQRWLPDLCIDSHGFPSHEWEQPFSGYAPFRFRDWWIPRAFFFFYLPFLEEPRGSLRRLASEALRDWVIGELAKEDEIVRRNRIFLSRYQKYRPGSKGRVDRSEGRIPCLPLQKRFRRTNYSYRFPRLTAVDFITEVADETARGNFLKDCVKAHLKMNLSLLRLLSSSDISVRKVCRLHRERIEVAWSRKRPLELRFLRKGG